MEEGKGGSGGCTGDAPWLGAHKLQQDEGIAPQAHCTLQGAPACLCLCSTHARSCFPRHAAVLRRSSCLEICFPCTIHTKESVGFKFLMAAMSWPSPLVRCWCKQLLRGTQHTFIDPLHSAGAQGDGTAAGCHRKKDPRGNSPLHSIYKGKKKKKKRETSKNNGDVSQHRAGRALPAAECDPGHMQSCCSSQAGSREQLMSFLSPVITWTS